jgi:hypothetical protein
MLGEPRFVLVLHVVLIDEPSAVESVDVLFDVLEGPTGVLGHEVLTDAAAYVAFCHHGLEY